MCIKHMLCMCTYMWEPWGVPAFDNSRPEVHAVQYYLCWPVKGGCLSVAAPHRVTPMDRFHLLCHQLCSHCMHTPHHRLYVTLHCAQTSAMICSISTTTKTTRRWPPRRDHPSRQHQSLLLTPQRPCPVLWLHQHHSLPRRLQTCMHSLQTSSSSCQIYHRSHLHQVHIHMF